MCLQFGCGAWRQCPANYTCTTFEDSTAVNTAGFENIGRALLAVYQVTSHDLQQTGSRVLVARIG
jgi:hypothetical protein